MSFANGMVRKSTLLLLVVFMTIGCKPASSNGASDQQQRESAKAEGATDSKAEEKSEAGDTPAVEWHRPRTEEAAKERRAMVAQQIKARGISDQAVLDAMRAVPRHWFVPDSLRSMAYLDRPLPIGEGQSISQPYIVAMMTEALQLDAESKVLEVGTGSGYQAAVLYEITPHVYTIEIVESLAERAKGVFKRRGYDGMAVRVGDGYAGWAEHAPFDAIIVTCAPDHIPPKLLEQLKPGGRLCIPVGSQGGVQELRLVTKLKDDELKRQTLTPVRFVPMTGEAQEKESD